MGGLGSGLIASVSTDLVRSAVGQGTVSTILVALLGISYCSSKSCV